MTRADAWIHFVSACVVDSGTTIANAVLAADRLLELFDKRFEPVPYGDGQAPLGTAPDTFQPKEPK